MLELLRGTVKVNMDSQKARRDSLLQRNMLLSMRLNKNYNGTTPPQNALKQKNTTSGNGAVKKMWRMDHSPQRSVPSKKGSPTRSLKNARSTYKDKPKLERTTTSPRKAQTEHECPSSLSRIHASSSPMKPRAISLDDFELGKKLGKGKFGRVYCVKHKKTGFICAMKAMEKSEIIQYNVEKQFRREVEIQNSLNHPNLTKLYGFFHDEKRVYLLMEYPVNGELYKLLKARGPLNDILASHYIYQMADALDFMHQRNIMHRDVKPENILIGFNNIIKLTDFGWSIISPRGTKRKTLCGTIDYLSPELLTSREYDDKVDVWALGVLAYELVANSPPFEEDSKDLTCKRIVRGDLRFPETVSSDAKDLISKLLRHRPKDRISLRDVKRHPWIMKNKPFW